MTISKRMVATGVLALAIAGTATAVAAGQAERRRGGRASEGQARERSAPQGNRGSDQAARAPRPEQRPDANARDSGRDQRSAGESRGNPGSRPYAVERNDRPRPDARTYDNSRGSDDRGSSDSRASNNSRGSNDNRAYDNSRGYGNGGAYRNDRGAPPRYGAPTRYGYATPRAVPRGRPLRRYYGSGGHLTVYFGMGSGYRYGSPYDGRVYGYSNRARAYGARYFSDVRLRVRPRDAAVYVDGYYAGIVDNFDGIFQRLTLEVGPHEIEIDAPGLGSQVFDVYVDPSRDIDLYADLHAYRP